MSEVLFLWMMGASLLTFLGSLVLVPWLIVRIPPDYFSHRRRPRPQWADRHPAARLLLKTLRNVAGACFLLVGLLMLALPGQGLLTMLVGLSLMSFPGKFRLERWAISRPPVLSAVNWLRQRAGRDELLLD